MTTLFEKSYSIQYTILNYSIILSYVIYFAALLGTSVLSPEKIDTLNEYAKIYIALFLIIRFNPFVNNKFSLLDKKIIYNAGLFLLATTTIGKLGKIYLNHVKNNFEKII